MSKKRKKLKIVRMTLGEFLDDIKDDCMLSLVDMLKLPMEFAVGPGAEAQILSVYVARTGKRTICIDIEPGS